MKKLLLVLFFGLSLTAKAQIKVSALPSINNSSLQSTDLYLITRPGTQSYSLTQSQLDLRYLPFGASFSSISGNISVTQMNSGTGANSSSFWRGDSTWAAISSGTVTSVAMSVPAFLSIGGSPVTTTGTLAVSYSGTALPVLNGGTGTTTSTGSGSTVLSASPTFSGTVLGAGVTWSGTNQAAVFQTGTATPATAGILRLANGDAVDWRNNANSVNIALAKDTSDNLTYNGNVLISSGGAVTAPTFSGDVTNVGTVTTVASVGGWTASSVSSAVSKVSTAATSNIASTLMARSTTGSTGIGRIDWASQTVSTASGTTTLTNASNLRIRFTGTLTQTLKLMDATTIATGDEVYVDNESTGAITIEDNGANVLFTLPGGRDVTIRLYSNGTANGTWHLNAPSLSNPTASVLGGIESVGAVAHNFLTSISTSGVAAQLQPAFTDISGTIAPTQMKAPTIQRFVSSSGTYTTPTSPPPLYLIVTVVGAGGGGAGAGTGAGTSASSGGATSFGTLVSANGGAPGLWEGGNGGTGGSTSTAAGFTVRKCVSGGYGGGAPYTGSSINVTAGGMGGVNPMGGAGSGGGALTSSTGNGGTAGVTNTGAGGGGGGIATAATAVFAGPGGGSGGFCEGEISSIAATYVYSIGAGGTAGGAGTDGGAGALGASGYIEVEERYQ